MGQSSEAVAELHSKHSDNLIKTEPVASGLWLAYNILLTV